VIRQAKLAACCTVYQDSVASVTTPVSCIVAEILHVKHLATLNYHWKCSDHHPCG